MFERLYVIVVLAKLSVRDINVDDFLVVVVVAPIRPKHTSALAWCADSRLLFLSQDD